MAGLREWLRPPGNVWIAFVLVVCLPAVTLIALGVRLLDQDHALARQRQIELLDRAADQGVRILEQDFSARLQQLSAVGCDSSGTHDAEGVCVVFHPGRIEAVPADRIAYYPRNQQSKEAPDEPFQEIEANEFRSPVHLDKALELSRQLAASNNAALRAGALLREARVLRKLGRLDEALLSFDALALLPLIGINREPADLVARRARCVILEEAARPEELHQEATALMNDLRSGKWQLDRDTFHHVDTQIRRWLGAEEESDAHDSTFSDALAWVYQKWIDRTPTEPITNGVHALNAGSTPVTVLWSFGGSHDAALLADARFMKSHWSTDLQKALEPAEAYITGTPPDGALRVQRSSAETGLPWTLYVAAAKGQEEPKEFRERRRNLMAGVAVLLILIAAGSSFTWRAVHREVAAARLQSDFVAAVSHEFRTPLTTLRQFNEILAEEDGPTAEQRHKFYQAQTRATERLYRLVESLLDFGRMEAGRRPYSFKPLDAGTLTRDVVDEFRCEPSASDFALECAADPSELPISGDPEALARAVWNLLDNAVKYSGKSRQVEVRASRIADRIAIAVRDHGIGIPAHEQKTIFQKFVRGTASKTGGIRGTGLGLAMVRHIVESHRGSLRLESVEGRGSTFTILLPARNESA